MNFYYIRVNSFMKEIFKANGIDVTMEGDGGVVTALSLNGKNV